MVYGYGTQKAQGPVVTAHHVRELHWGDDMYALCSCDWAGALYRRPKTVDVAAWRMIRAAMVEAANAHLVDAGARQPALTSLEVD